MANKLPEIVFNLPDGKLPERAVKAIHEYNTYIMNEVLNQLPAHQRKKAYDIIMADLRNGGKEFREFFI